MLRITLACALSLVATLSGCDVSGACVGTGGVVDECKQDWSADECRDWDEQEVNGASWSFHAAQSCDALGFSVECPDGSFVTSSSDC